MYDFKKLGVTKTDIKNLKLWLKLVKADKHDTCGFQVLGQNTRNTCTRKHRICWALFPTLDSFGPFCPCYYHSISVVVEKVKGFINEYEEVCKWT